MSQNKNTINISDLKDFFTSREKVISELFSLLSSLTVSLSDIFTGNYQSSMLHQFLGGGKDLFYHLLNDEDMPWRRLLYRMNVRLINRRKRGEALRGMNVA